MILPTFGGFRYALSPKALVMDRAREALKDTQCEAMRPLPGLPVRGLRDSRFPENPIPLN